MAQIAGIACELGATILGTVGKQLVSYSARLEPGPSAQRAKILGLTITTAFGPVLDSAAYGLAPQTIIAPLNGLDIVWNMLVAPCTLGERRLKRHVVASILIFLGASLCSTISAVASEDMKEVNGPVVSVDTLWEVYASWRFFLYCLAFAAGLLISADILRRNPKGCGSQARGVALGVTAGAVAGNVFFISLLLGVVSESIRKKDLSTFTHGSVYFTAVGAALSAICNIPLMSRGLQEYEALFMVTLFEGSHILVACFTGQFLLRQMRGAAWHTFVTYWLFVLWMVMGLLIIQSTAVSVKRQPELADKCMEASVEDKPRTEISNVDEEAQTLYLDPDFNLSETLRSTVVWAGGASGIGFLGIETDDRDHSDEESCEG